METPATDEAQRVTLTAWLVTDIGMVREHNEDSAHMDPARGFFIVADGMGGHAAGEVASAMAVETVKTSLEAAGDPIRAFVRAPTDVGRRNLVQLLQNAVLNAHQAVFQRGSAEADKAGMGTTLDVVLIAGPEAFVAHVGDSRTYLIRDGRASQITTDHTVAEVLVIEGKLTIEEAQVSPLRTILVNAIGVSADVGVEMAHVHLRRGDRLLLCSDGLHDYFPAEDEISQRLGADQKVTPGPASEGAPSPDAGAILAEMVELAKERGGHDNITGVAVQILEVVEAVPVVVEHDSTQPVEMPLNPFASDEPTETATTDGTSLRPPARTAAELARQTQPMRSMVKLPGEPSRRLAHADTVPPEDPEPTQEMTPTPRVHASTAAAAASPVIATPPRDPADSTAPLAKLDDLDEADGASLADKPDATSHD
jgi:serine/threonine protein phosphatase PrpC